MRNLRVHANSSSLSLVVEILLENLADMSTWTLVLLYALQLPLCCLPFLDWPSAILPVFPIGAVFTLPK